MTTTADTGRTSARDRLLAAANELFYAEGVHTVGIDRIIERAGVAKASLYSSYGSKDGLVEAYLRSRHATIADRMARSLRRHSNARERLLGVFDAQAETFARPGFRGCAFVNATSEAHDARADAAADDYRLWVRALFTELAEDAGVADPDTLARQLHLLYDGAGVSARMDRDPRTAAITRAAAAALLDTVLRSTQEMATSSSSAEG
jgi:AcrR family transcriptional regulator